MAQHLYTVEQAAGLLELHVKTIRRYIHEGKLKAKRIGKEYRITRPDLEEFTGSALPAQAVAAVPRTRQVIASSIVDVDAISPEDSHRITTFVMASLNSRRGEGDFPNVNSVYYPEMGKLRITITANPTLTASMLQMINSLLESNRDNKHL
jgi:excisionase family DNA binding protein